MILKFAVENPLIFLLLAALVSLGIVAASRRSALAVKTIRERLGVKARWLARTSSDEKRDLEGPPYGGAPPGQPETKIRLSPNEQRESTTSLPQLGPESSIEQKQLTIPGILAYDGVQQVYEPYIHSTKVEYAPFEKLRYPLKRLPVLPVLVMQPVFETLAEIAFGSDLQIIGVTYRSEGQAAKLYVSPGKGDLKLERGPEAWSDTVIVSAGRYSSPTVLLLKELIDKVGKSQIEIRYQSEDGAADFSLVPGKVVVVVCNNDAYSALALTVKYDVAIAAAPVSVSTLTSLKQSGSIEILDYSLQKKGREKWPANLLVTREENLKIPFYKQQVKSALRSIREANHVITKELKPSRGVTGTAFLQKLLGMAPTLDFCDPPLFGDALEKLHDELLGMCTFAKDVFIFQEDRDPFDFKFRKRLIASLVEAEEGGLAKPEQPVVDHTLQDITQVHTNTEESQT